MKPRTAKGAQQAKAVTGVAGAALATAGSAILPIPVVGWIAGGALVLVGGALSLASGQFNPERAAARQALLEQGVSPAFANAFARAQSWPDAKLSQEIGKADKAFRRRATSEASLRRSPQRWKRRRRR